GVLSVLEEAGVPIDCVAGTSAGSIVGAAYCAGLGAAQMREMSSQMGWRHIASPVWPRRGLVSFERMEPWLESFVGELDVADLPLPFVAIATDVYTGESVTLDQGRLATAVRASSSVPGVVEPVELDGRLLCDGGIANNLPVDATRALGADYVIGVDLFAPEYDGRWGPLGLLLTAAETLIRHSGGGVTEADCLIVPPIDDHSFVSFSNNEQFIALGKAAARQKISQIIADLGL
ncbi:MAG: patatin-like phospholipase family protein, partial [Chloroflexi bacterium]|nr:patatin-like phospholipase family protein [Chloroflexota bacterium]